MIKNIIFDFGNVLTQYDPVAWASQLMGGDTKKGSYLHEKTINNKKIWNDYDAGLCSEKQIIDRLCDDIEPEYHKAVTEFVTTVDKCFDQYDQMVPILQQLKDKGLHLFLLSNFPKEMFKRVSVRCPILDLLDEKIVSCDIHLIKPHKEIFEYILNTYCLRADQTLFTDDMKINTDAAMKAGMHAHTFTTAQNFTDHLKAIGIF